MSTHSNNLDTFRILFLIKGILTLLVSVIFLAYGAIGLFLGNIDDVHYDNEFNPGFIFLIIGGMGFIFTIVFGILTILAGKYLKETRNYNFILVIAILNCLTGVLGILLGVFTIVELNKSEVRALFNESGHTPQTT